eukprot:m.114986 g.114986  ORF g.114986 m.114986 type:complete len:436 (-) comp12833_c2_seq13:164-1471(-)
MEHNLINSEPTSANRRNNNTNTINMQSTFMPNNFNHDNHGSNENSLTKEDFQSVFNNNEDMYEGLPTFTDTSPQHKGLKMRARSISPRNTPYGQPTSPNMRRRAISSSTQGSMLSQFNSVSPKKSLPRRYTAPSNAQLDREPSPLKSKKVTNIVKTNIEEDLANLFSATLGVSGKKYVPLRSRELPPSFWSRQQAEYTQKMSMVTQVQQQQQQIQMLQQQLQQQEMKSQLQKQQEALMEQIKHLQLLQEQQEQQEQQQQKQQQQQHHQFQYLSSSTSPQNNNNNTRLSATSSLLSSSSASTSFSPKQHQHHHHQQQKKQLEQHQHELPSFHHQRASSRNALPTNRFTGNSPSTFTAHSPFFSPSTPSIFKSSSNDNNNNNNNTITATTSDNNKSQQQQQTTTANKQQLQLQHDHNHIHIDMHCFALFFCFFTNKL